MMMCEDIDDFYIQGDTSQEQFFQTQPMKVRPHETEMMLCDGIVNFFYSRRSNFTQPMKVRLDEQKILLCDGIVDF